MLLYFMKTGGREWGKMEEKILIFAPEAEVIRFSKQDIIRTSTENPGSGDGNDDSFDDESGWMDEWF